MAMYIGKNGAKKKASTIYIGKSGSRKEVVEAYYGKNGRRRVYNVPVESGQKVFTSSGTFTVPKRVKKVDIFLVGGGGAGGWGYGSGSGGMYSGSGGGGGYTKTIKGVSVTPGYTYSIVVGAGLAAGSSYNAHTEQSVGGTSTAFGYSATGGHAGKICNFTHSGRGTINYGDYSCGGSGGGCSYYYVNAVIKLNGPAPGGTDGGWGCINIDSIYDIGESWSIDKIKESDKYSTYLSNSNIDNILAGQGNTTRAFGESTGTLYSSGGNGGMSLTSADADSGTGNGGNGAGCSRSGGGYNAGAGGGSGCVIIRWGY